MSAQASSMAGKTRCALWEDRTWLEKADHSTGREGVLGKYALLLVHSYPPLLSWMPYEGQLLPHAPAPTVHGLQFTTMDPDDFSLKPRKW